MPEHVEPEPADVWSAVAEGWDRHHDQLSAHTRPITTRMIDLAAVQPGEVVLELAAGIGDISRTLARAVAPDGQVICSDASPRMVEAARRRSTEDADRLTFRTIDAQRIDLADDTVDVVVCKMGLMLLPDPAAAATECRRVLRRGGRLVAATWAGMEHNLWIATIGAAMLTHGHTPPRAPTDPGGIASLSEPAALEALLGHAGFQDVAVEVVDVPEHVGSFDDYWRLRAATSGSLTATLRQLDADQVAAVRATCEQYAEGLRQPDGSYVFPGRALVAHAR